VHSPLSYNGRKAQGLCVHSGCPSPTEPQKTKCAMHAAISVKQRVARINRRKADRKCVDCAKPAAFGHIRCVKHNRIHTDKNRARYERLNRTDITTEEIEASLQEQKGHCWFCPLTGKHGGRNRFHLDRDHAHGCPDHDDSKICSKCFRGHLCYGHNVWLGQMEKTGKTTPEVDEYLKRRPILEMRKTGKTAEEMSIWVTNKVVLMRI
jgi:hypothetical protein